MIIINGETFIPTREAAEALGINRVTLKTWTWRDKRTDVVITLPSGLRFIRCPRFPGDPRAPVFWAVEGVSVPKPVHGFATMSKEKIRAAQAKGLETRRLKGHSHHYKSEATREAAREGGRKGGIKVSQDREHMREIGRIGRSKGPRNRRQK